MVRCGTKVGVLPGELRVRHGEGYVRRGGPSYCEQFCCADIIAREIFGLI